MWLFDLLRAPTRVAEMHRMLMREMPMARESFEALKEAVEKATTTKQAAIQLIQHMGDRLQEMAQHQPTPQELQQLAQELRSHAEALAEAVAEHEE